MTRTPLNILATDLIPVKRVGLEMTKRATFYSLYDAYEYGTERAKPGANGRK